MTDGMNLSPADALEDSLSIFAKSASQTKSGEGIEYLRWRKATTIQGFRKAYYSLADSVLNATAINKIDPMYICRKLDMPYVIILIITDDESIFEYDIHGGTGRFKSEWVDGVIVDKVKYSEEFSASDFRAVLAIYESEAGKLVGLSRVSAKDYSGAREDISLASLQATLCKTAIDVVFENSEQDGNRIHTDSASANYTPVVKD